MPNLTQTGRYTFMILFSAALFPMWYISSLYLQQVLGLSPLLAGLTFLPMALTIMATASQAGKLVSRFGVKAVLGAGLTMMTVAMLLFARIAVSGNSFVHAVYYIMLPGVLKHFDLPDCYAELQSKKLVSTEVWGAADGMM